MASKKHLLAIVALGMGLGSCKMAPPYAPAPKVDDPNRVLIYEYRFVPPRMVVPVGTKVTWQNLDYVMHTATSAATDDPFDSRAIEMQTTYSRTFAKKGEFPYLCIPHPGMKGVIVVE